MVSISKSFILLSLLPFTAAFLAPSSMPSSSRRVNTVSMAAEGRSTSVPFLKQQPNLDGSMAGDVGFDPLGLSNINDVGIDLYWLREAEIKHGRLGMLAAAGILFVEAFGTAPGFTADTNCQMDTFWNVWYEKPTLVGSSLLAISVLEIIGGIAITEGRKNGDRAPGDYNFDPLGFGNDPQKIKTLQLKEIKNGRLGMIAAAGLILQGCMTHQGGLENLFGN